MWGYSSFKRPTSIAFLPRGDPTTLIYPTVNFFTRDYEKSLKNFESERIFHNPLLHEGVRRPHPPTNRVCPPLP